MNLLSEAKDFFHGAHNSIKQVRKYSLEPYTNHLDAVENRFAQFYPDCEIGRIAAFGHDYKEDVLTHPDCPAIYKTEAFTIRNLFGAEVDWIIDALTHKYTHEAYPHLSRHDRKQLEAQRLGSYAWTKFAEIIHSIKLSDLIHNSISIVAEDKKFAAVYLVEKEFLLRHLQCGHRNLQEIAWASLNDGLRKIK